MLTAIRGVHGLPDIKALRPFKDGRRVFYTQQHGDNLTYEIIENEAPSKR